LIHLFVGLFCLLSLPASTPAQEGPTPSAARGGQGPRVDPQPQGAADFAQQPFVIERYYTTVRYENDGTGERDLAVRIRVHSEAGAQRLAELAFGYSSANEQMEVRFVRVTRADGEIVSAGSDAVKDVTALVARDAPAYADYKEKRINVPLLHPGDTLEYEIATRAVIPFAPGEFWFEQNFLDAAIVLDEQLELNVPLDRRITLKSPGHSYSTDLDDAKRRTTYRWKHANLTVKPNDDPSKKKSQQHAGKLPDVQLTTFASWQEVARWYAGLGRGPANPTPEIRAKSAELTHGRTSELDKIEALYDYVAKNTDYVNTSFGLFRYPPHSAAEVFTDQYGDSQDKATLLAAMLEAAGIHADAVLVPTSQVLDASLPSPSQFDHVLTAVPDGHDLIWMDSTAGVAPFRLLASALRGKSALLVPPDGEGRIVETPADPPFLSIQRVKIEGTVSGLGKLTANIHYSLRGDTELVLRLAFRRTPPTQWKDLGQTILTLDGVHGEVTSVKPGDPLDTHRPFEIDMEFAQSNFLDWSSKEARVAVPLARMGLPDAPDGSAEAIALGSPLDVSAQVKLTLPANLTAQPPVAIAVARDYAEFKSSYQFENRTVTAERSLNFKMRELPASRVGDYRTFRRAVTEDENQVLLIENSATGAPVISGASAAEDLLEAGTAALHSGNARAAIPLLERILELEPQHRQAWSNLGLAYLRLGRFTEAEVAFRKQIEVNAGDEHSYDYLGLVLERQEKTAEAAEAFRRQIELDPLDTVAHAALGELLLNQHKYKEAVPELDKATILSPDDAELQVSLGQACINTGETEKALAAFKKGVEISQSPSMLNNVAFRLADNKMDLDLAQHYAELAVSAIDAKLQKIELSQLKADDVSAVAAIGNYWDTLGWVFVQKGDLDFAERYIQAAWLLNQRGEVGDHLAQIYEKRGQKDRAVHMYSLAIAGSHPDPETRARLTLLLGGNEKIDALVSRVKPELITVRTLSAGNLLAEDAKADFLVLLSPGEKTARVNAVQFLGGAQKLRGFADRLHSLDYGPLFPDASPVKLVRRGTLSCSAATGECDFILLLPDDVHRVN
jgi:Flp pilus assembly protein TadD/transglutaminase-like putative cysteine protease